MPINRNEGVKHKYKKIQNNIEKLNLMNTNKWILKFYEYQCIIKIRKELTPFMHSENAKKIHILHKY